MLPALVPILLGVSVDPDALAHQAAVLAAGGTYNRAQLLLVSTLIRFLKSAGVWTLLDRLWLFASENATQALIDLVARASATAVNSPTFTASQGYAGNGSSSYVDTNFNLSAATNFTQNSASAGAYIRTSRTAGQTYTAFGALGAAAGDTSLSPRWTDTNLYWGVNDASTSTAAAANIQGQWIVARTAANAAAVYRNGDTTAFTTSALASAARPNQTVVVLASRSGVGAVIEFSADQVGAFFAGAGLTANQQASVATAINAYMTSLGTNVY